MVKRPCVHLRGYSSFPSFFYLFFLFFLKRSVGGFYALSSYIYIEDRKERVPSI